MKTADSLNRIKNGTKWISLLSLVAFIGLLYSDCICDPFCGGSRESVMEQSACCAGCTTAEPIGKGCCSGDPGMECGTIDPSDFLLSESNDDCRVKIINRLVRSHEWIVKLKEAPCVEYQARLPADRAKGPPIYLRFEILRT